MPKPKNSSGRSNSNSSSNLSDEEIRMLAFRLASAIKGGIWSISNIFDQAGADAARVIGWQDSHGCNALYYAAVFNKLNMVRFLVKKLGANAAYVLSLKKIFVSTPLELAIKNKNVEMFALFIASLGIGIYRAIGANSLNDEERNLLNKAMPGALKILLDKLINGEVLTEAQYALCHERRDQLCDIFLDEDVRGSDLTTLKKAINPKTSLGKVFCKHKKFPFGKTDSVKKIKARIDEVNAKVAQAEDASAGSSSGNSAAEVSSNQRKVFEFERTRAKKNAKDFRNEIEWLDPEADAAASLDAWKDKKHADKANSSSASSDGMFASGGGSSSGAAVSSSAAADGKQQQQQEDHLRGAPSLTNSGGSGSGSGG